MELTALCPWWARVFIRPDGHWIAYCSKAACQKMNTERTDWRDAFEMPRVEVCNLGFPETSAENEPAVMTSLMTNGMAAEDPPTAENWSEHARDLPIWDHVEDFMTDDLWERCLEAFLEFPIEAAVAANG